MTELEHELKCILDSDEYDLILKVLDTIPYIEETQINYYYDTLSEKLRYENITLRIRQKNGRFRGTIKKYLKNSHCSEETSFKIDHIPSVMVFESVPVYLKGSLKTKRITKYLSESVKIMVDKNEYLGTQDFELEIECPEDFLTQAGGILFLLKKIINSKREEGTMSKSERFFLYLHKNAQEQMNIK